MTVHQPIAQFKEKTSHAIPRARIRSGYSFDIHPALHFATAACYLAFAGILGTTFMGPHLVVPIGIVVISIIAMFVVPGLWARVDRNDSRKQSWLEFMGEGVDCYTGKLTAGQAIAQVIVLPVLIVSLGLVFAIIKATL